jgi:SAM-dependent methyltransferase
LRRARANAPAADLVRADIASCAFRPASFEAIVSLYAIFHVPREHHAPVLRRARRWLRPGGWLFASFAREDEAPYTEEFFGVRMYWSNYGIARYLEMLSEAGFAVEQQGILEAGLRDVAPERHPYIVARARGGAA